MVRVRQLGGSSSASPYPDLGDAISRNARERGEKVFLRSVDQGKEITFGDLERFCGKISRFLAQRGLGRGDTVSVLGKNSIETLLLYYGTLYHGAVINPINVDESPENVYKILALVKPALLVYDREIPLDAERLSGLSCLPFGTFDSAAGPPGDFFSLLGEAGSEEHREKVSPDDLAEVVFTSGTTSTPKGVCIARGPLFAMAGEVAEKIGVGGEDVLLEYRNYNWASAQLLTILSSVLVGATLILARRFSRSRFPNWLAEHGVTVSAGVPTVINILAHEPVSLPNGGLARLRFMTSSSAPLSVASQLAFEKLYGVPVLQMAGMTEAGFMLGSPFEGRKTGSAGTPCRFKEVFFVNPDQERCGPGEEGEMLVRGYSMGIGYLQEDGSILPFPDEGFRTGDLGYMDSDGFAFITGRVKDLIIRGGVNIAPMEITTRIMEHPSVKEAATIGVPDPIYGEEVASFVVAKEGCALDAASIVAHCRKSLPEFKVPKQVYVLPSIPKTVRGKVSKEHLLEVVQEHQRESQGVPAF